MSTNRPLQHVAPRIIHQLADDEALYEAYANKHLTAIKRVLDHQEPDYAQ
jgi:hypothetical protein